MSGMRETILDAARLTVQAHGYSGLSFRELAKEVGIKSGSMYYHFPSKGDLGAALARRYREDAAAAFDRFWAEDPDPARCLRLYTDVFRLALANDNRMCLCGFMAAEFGDLPDMVKTEVQAFADLNVAWLAKILSSTAAFRDAKVAEERAYAIYAAIGGAQLAARSRADIGVYDRIVEGYRAAGLIPA